MGAVSRRPVSHTPSRFNRVQARPGSNGKADLTASLEPKNEWDIAAGALLVEAAGGKVTDLTGECLRFNRPETLVNGIVAGPDQLVDEMLAQLRCTSDE